jgi:hypothetical protein
VILRHGKGDRRFACSPGEGISVEQMVEQGLEFGLNQSEQSFSVGVERE